MVVNGTVVRDCVGQVRLDGSVVTEDDLVREEAGNLKVATTLKLSAWMELTALAHERECSVAALVREAVGRFLAEEAKP